MQNSRRWLGVVTLLVLIVIAYVDRVNVAIMVVNPAFLEHFSLVGDRLGQGELMTMFLLGYGVSAMFLTPFMETLMGYRRGLQLSVALWALLSAIVPVAGSLMMLLFLRALLGISEGPLFSLKTMYIRHQFAPGEVGKPNAVSSLGVPVGLAVGFPLVSFLVFHFEWELSFYILAALNLLLGLMLIYCFIPQEGERQNKPRVSVRQTFMMAWQTPMLGWIIVVEIATLSYLWGSSSWLPAYLVDDKHFSFKMMGWLSSLPFLMTMLANYTGGAILDKIKPQYAPLLFVGGGMATALCVLGLMDSHAIGWTAFFLLAANGCWGIQSAAIPTLVQYHAKAEAVGSAYGIINGIGNIFSAFIPMIMGLVMHYQGSVSSGFSVLVGAQLLTVFAGAMLFLRMRQQTVKYARRMHV